MDMAESSCSTGRDTSESRTIRRVWLGPARPCRERKLGFSGRAPGADRRETGRFSHFGTFCYESRTLTENPQDGDWRTVCRSSSANARLYKQGKAERVFGIRNKTLCVRY